MPVKEALDLMGAPLAKPRANRARVLPGRVGRVTGSASASPLVSILIPAFNAQEWIGETLRSVLGQTWERKEIIVVDDGSTDRPSLLRAGSRRKGSVVTQKNQGASAAGTTHIL